jgi:hypothetical protein
VLGAGTSCTPRRWCQNDVQKVVTKQAKKRNPTQKQPTDFSFFFFFWEAPCVHIFDIGDKKAPASAKKPNAKPKPEKPGLS